MALTTEQALGKAQKLYGDLQKRRPVVELLDGYYRGEQPLAFASDEWSAFHKARYKGFADNWCGVVGNSPTERERVDGFRLDEATEVTDQEKQLWRDWLLNDMEAQSSQGFLASTVTSRSFVLVWGDDDDEPVATWESASQAIVEYDPQNQRKRRFGLKAWAEDGYEFATLYEPEAVWKWWRNASHLKDSNGQTESGLTIIGNLPGGEWSAREVDGEPWPLPNPMGEVPLVEVPNRPMLDGTPMSDIQGTMAMQDAINLLWAYLFTSADSASFPGRVILGAEPPKVPILDEHGQKIGEKVVDMKALAMGRFMFLTSTDAKIDQWDAADLNSFTSVVEIAIGHIAAQTRTPPHYLVTNKGLSNLSGDALVAAETGLVQKVQEAQLFFSPAMREVFRLFALVRGNKNLADQCRLGTVLWKDAQYRSDAQLADANTKRRTMGYPLEYILELEGLPPHEVERVLAMVEREKRDPQLDEVAGLSPTDDFAKRVTAAGTLIRSGFDPEASVAESGLPKIKHTGLLPVTVQSEDKANAGPQQSQEGPEPSGGE